MSEHAYYQRGPFRGRWIAPDRRWQARLWCQYAIDRWDDDVIGRRVWAERFYVPSWGVLDKVFGLTCRVAGHLPADDHCGMPVHRYCEVCKASTPNAEVKAR